MVYKKYIKRGGKVYGPYVYHSKRVDGKVVSEYRGSKGKKSFDKKYLWAFLGVAFVLGLFLILPSDRGISGQAILGVEADYVSGELLNGVLKFSLKEGELIPADTKVVFENSGGNYEYELLELIPNETLEGDFYIEGKDISGSGSGYGKYGVIPGKSEISFVLTVSTLNETQEETNVEISEEDSEEEVEEESNESINESFENETVGVVEQGENETNVTNSSFNNSNVSEVVINESENLSVEENSSQEETVNEELIENETSEDSEISETEETQEDLVDGDSEENQTEEQSNAPITGGVITSWFRWRGTGNVVSEGQNEISGKVSKNKPFVYELDSNQKVELKSGSVELKSGEGSLPDNVLDISVEGNKVIVTTNYSYDEIGFGKDYLGEDLEILVVNISEFNMTFDEGYLNISLVYSEEEIVSLNTILEDGSSLVNETNTLNANNSNVTLDKVVEQEEIVKVVLTESEKQILRDEFGNVSVQNVRSEIIDENIFIGYEFSGERVEFVYDSYEKTSRIKELAESDKNRWLKEIASKVVSKKDFKSEEVGIVDEVSEI